MLHFFFNIENGFYIFLETFYSLQRTDVCFFFFTFKPMDRSGILSFVIVYTFSFGFRFAIKNVLFYILVSHMGYFYHWTRLTS